MSGGSTYAAGTYDDSNWLFITVTSADITVTSPAAYKQTEFSNVLPSPITFGYGTNVQMCIWSVSYTLGAGDPNPQYQFACDFIPADQYNGSARTTICSPVVVLDKSGVPTNYVPERLQWFDTLLSGGGNSEFAFAITKGGQVPGKAAGVTNYFTGDTTFTFALREVA